MTFRYLTHEQLEEVVRAALGAGLADAEARKILLSDVNRSYALTLNQMGNPLFQLRSDLTRMNQVERLADGTVPLQIWLREAGTLAAPLTEAAVFHRYLETVVGQASGRAELPDPASLPEVVNNEAIVHQDDMVSFGFLARGARVGASVAKLLVPRFDNGTPHTTAAGAPAVYLGTGWLITPQLLVTNHHVVNARGDLEPNAGEADLRAQAAGTIARFDFDSANAQGLDRPVSQIEAWNPREDLDFAILRLAAPVDDRAPLALARAPLTHAANDYRPVNIIQHPGGNEKRVAFRNNLVTAADQTSIRYFTDTMRGSSGSPVCDDDWRVVALHRGSRTAQGVTFQGKSTAVVNFGTQMSAILDHVKNHHPELRTEIDEAVP